MPRWHIGATRRYAVEASEQSGYDTNGSFIRVPIFASIATNVARSSLDRSAAIYWSIDLAMPAHS